MRKKIAILFFLFVNILAFADDVSFRADAPKQVIMGKPFRLTYTINQHARDLRAPEMENFDIVAGPYTSQADRKSVV